MMNNNERVLGAKHGKVANNVVKDHKNFNYHNNKRKETDDMKFKTGDIIMVNFEGNKGSEQGGKRPCVIISDTFKNQKCPVLQVAPITGFPKECPDRHVYIQPEDEIIKQGQQKGIYKTSAVLIEQMGKIDKCRIEGYRGRLTAEKMREVKDVIIGFLGL